MSRVLACLVLSLGSVGCIEDTTYGLDAAPLSLPRGVTRPIGFATPAPPASALVIEVDDPALATVGLSADGRRVEVHAVGEGETVVHLLYREQIVHVPTTVLPAAVVSLAVQPGDVTAQVGSAIALSALVTNTADEQVDVTSQVVWTVDDPRIARLYSDGTLEAMSSGTTQLRAEIEGVVSTAPVVIR